MNKKQEFLKRVEPLSVADIKWLNSLADKKLHSYYIALIENKAHNSPVYECKDNAIKLNSLLQELYTNWYDNFASQKFGFFAKRKFKLFLEDAKYNPHTEEHKAFLASSVYTKYQSIMSEIKNNYPAVFSANISTFPYFDQGLEFVHFINRENGQAPVKTECRFYLNVKTKNTFPIAKALLEKAKEEHLPLMFKVSLTDDRNESIVIYTNYEHASEVVDILDGIKATRPYYFEGAEQIPEHLGKVNGYLGFGEEPTQNGQSYTSMRGKAIKRLSENKDTFAEIDVPNLKTDAKYMMLNASTIRELKKDGFALEQIGSLATGAQRY